MFGILNLSISSARCSGAARKTIFAFRFMEIAMNPTVSDLEGAPKFETSQDIPFVPCHRFAELIGLRGIYVDDAERMGTAWDEALASDRPVVLEVKADPNIAPLPPHITLAQAKAFASTLMQGDPDESNVIVETAKQVLEAVIPGPRDK
jgi:pyruvate dehydrogenase (quinone)